MAEPLRETSPWAGLWRRGRFGRSSEAPGLDIVESERSATGLLTVRKDRQSDLLRAARDLGLDLPTTPSWRQDRGFTVLWAGPGQWLVRGPRGFADLAAALEPLSPFATAIDQSHARAVLIVAGPCARDVLAKGFEIDLHPRAFRPGDLALTTAAAIPAIVWQLDERPTFEIAVPRSYAGSFWHWLSGSAAEHGYRIGREA